MTLRFLLVPISAAALLLSTLSCTKKDEAASPTGSASYKLDGVARTCTTSAVANSISGTYPTDILTISLLTTPEPASGRELVTLFYMKLSGQPVTAYQLNSISYLSKGSSASVQPTSTTSLTQTSSGGLAGVFAGTFSGTTTGQGSGTLTDGTFTEVRTQ